MDFLNNVWIAFSTENEFLIKLLYIPFTIIEAILMLALFTTILNINTDKRKSIIYIFLASIIALISQYIIPSPYNVFINYICLFILIKLLYKTSFLKTLLAIILPTIILALFVTIFSNILANVFNITAIQLEQIPIYRFILLLSTYLFCLFIILIVKFTKTNILLPKQLNKKTKTLFILTFIFGIVIIFAQSSMLYIYLDSIPLIYSLVSFFSLLVYFSLSIYSLNKVVQLEQTTMDLKNSEEYNNTLQIMHDNVRCFKHDFDNIVTTIGGYIATEDMEGLKKYYKELEKDCKIVNNSYILNPKIINNPGVYSILINKYKRAEDLNINVNLEYLLDMENLQMDVYQFTRILGILLDNAIEAAENSKEKLINIYFREEANNNRQIILIENSYSNKEIDTESIYEKNKTEKENHSGLGLYEVRKIINKNNNINLYTSKDDILFKQQLEIYFK